jgi:Predicted acyl esterases
MAGGAALVHGGLRHDRHLLGRLQRAAGGGAAAEAAEGGDLALLTDDRYADDVHYMGGCLLVDNFAWGSTMFTLQSYAPDPALVGERWREMWRERLENHPLLVDNWLQHQRRDAYWKHGSVIENYGDITAAVYAVGGWADGYSNAVPRLLAGLNARKRGWSAPGPIATPIASIPAPPSASSGNACAGGTSG